ncbi:MAG: hypothetical protein J7M19_06050 [Planctomycetes bacterium]|nr:hypothetical protein [Planctomycetota bacterium]
MKKPDLSPEEKILVIIRDELYDGSWDDMLDDLKARLGSRPYVLKLASRIEDDVERIRRLRVIEDEEGINLAEYIEGS